MIVVVLKVFLHVFYITLLLCIEKKKKPRAVLLMIFLVFLGFYLKKKLVFLDFLM